MREKMGTLKDNHISVCHVVALPYPGRGHINPMMNLCKLLSSKKPDNTLLITFVVTEEWHGFIGSDPKPDNIRFAKLPNAIPSELVRAKDFPGFVEAVSTKLEAPFEQLVDRLEPPVSAIVADPYVVWAVRVGNRRNIPVAALWPMSASVFSFFHHFELLKQNGHFPLDVTERGDEIVDYIPGLGTTSIADLPTIFSVDGQKVLDRAIEAVSGVADKAQYLLSTSVYELEPQVFDTLKAKFAFPVYPIGPSIPHLELSESPPTDHNDLNNWLDSQPKHSVLYISLGSFLSVSKSQMDEIVAGVRNSGVRFLWVARGDASKLKDGVGDKGLVVPWCDQLRVLCHDSIGGFWSHCGWNSTLEAVYAGLPVLTCPIFWDQMPDSKQIVEDWKIGYRVLKKKVGAAEHEHLVTREEIAELVQRFMDLESKEGKEMRKRAKQLQETCHGAIAKVAVPYPGRGHINPIINLCKLLASRKNDIQITVVVTEEWLGFIGSDPKPNNISFRTIPNVLPSELVRGTNYPAFYEAVMTKMEAPFEKLLDQIHPPVTAIIADIELLWAVPAGRWRNIPVASLSTLSASVIRVMATSDVDSVTVSHVAAMPFPGRGHINPMMNLCKLLASKNPQLLISFVVTEEWRGFISSDPKPDNIRLASIPNVIPPERLKAADFPGFYEAVMTKMEAPFELLLDRLEPPVSAVIADIEVRWGVGFGIRRNIPVSLFWTMSATFLSMLHRFNVFSQNKNIPVEFFDCGDQIPGISSTDLADLGEVFKGNDPKVIKLALECISWVPKAQYLLFTSVYELEPQIFDSLQAEFPFPVYPIGPAIPYLEPEHNCSVSVADNSIDYLKWLDSQPKGSVLYISLGSFLSVSSTQMDEIAAGLRNSGIRYLWVARGRLLG
ncbi:UDP-Glycosyltransferase superfamily protein [Prunus dulcis]|uniref:UDP-Glycosyltransferase superfamily protein n=1 Tax=Prunus dulcis TaxID=3755 RepID=A0A4Y1RL36_PRUDU|nr:UDP-Glycosyltransferase superfamily protein [Prunus dulcis]